MSAAPATARAARAMLNASIRRSVRRDLGGVWAAGPLPAGGAVLAPNHASWWDGYLLRELAAHAGRPVQVLMDAGQYARFPFLRLVGAVPPSGLRTLVGAARAGAWVVVFPEGRIGPGPLQPLHPGAAWVARTAGVPLVPVAVRVVVRGARWPEAYLRAGAPCEPDGLEGALGAVLGELDAALHAADPERPLPGYTPITAGRREPPDVPLASRLLARLTRGVE
ncbi:lysophospholipid acyltransferase family protein [Deinococcus ficus]|nr:1-acyl-sn-glycerol-3-phosphate acyltransferase [Deinococcus ficus]